MRLLFLALSIFFITATQHAEAADFTNPQICKAGISKVMYRNPQLMQVQKRKDGIHFVTYVRNDGQFFSYKCRIKQNRIEWGKSDGRWRNHSADGKLSFQIDNQNITVTEAFPDGSKDSKSYTHSGL